MKNGAADEACRLADELMTDERTSLDFPFERRL